MTELDAAAFKVVDLAKALALADNHFLSAAVGRLKVLPIQVSKPFATDGFVLGINPFLICQQFKREKSAPKHDLIHAVLHCVFLHPYISSDIDQRLWDLACDIAVERNVALICGKRAASRGDDISRLISDVGDGIKGTITAEKIYRALREGLWSDQIERWSELVAVDDHALWYEAGDYSQQAEKDDERTSSEGSEDQGASSGNQPRNQETTNQEATGDRPQIQINGDQLNKNVSSENVDSDEVESNQPLSEEMMGSGSQGLNPGWSSVVVRGHEAVPFREILRARREQEQEGWRLVARTLSIALRTYAKGRGKSLESVASELEEASDTRVDYADFLRQFAIPGEVLKVSEDEFDYIFYTYGLELYGNLPLIEPLEYREEKRIREFVIVIDTSGSVQGNLVRIFIGATFDILKSTEAFFERVHVRIIQCDAKVQSDDVVTNLNELKDWNRTMQIHGCGGTDFRPAFAYVDGLVEKGVFENLGGLIYFTDGWGTYPEWVPDYKVAFVFYSENYCSDIVPTWAAQIILDKDAIKDAQDWQGV